MIQERNRSAEVAAPSAPAAEAASSENVWFEPFELTVLCHGCNRPLELFIQPLHFKEEIRCPRCLKQLSPQIRREALRRLRAAS